MTDLDKLAELAERLERASGPDRELDVEIAFAIGLVHEQEGNLLYGKDADYVIERGYYDHGGNPGELPYFSASLDSAMSLVPEGYKWAVTQQDSDKPNRQWWGELRRGHWTSYDKAFPAIGATPALALAAASLRALSMMKVGNTGETGRSSTDGEGAR